MNMVQRGTQFLYGIYMLTKLGVFSFKAILKSCQLAIRSGCFNLLESFYFIIKCMKGCQSNIFGQSLMLLNFAKYHMDVGSS